MTQAILIVLSLFLNITFAQAEDCTLEIEVKGAIGAATLDYIERAEEEALNKNCSSILMLINTPGGSLQSTRMIIEKILNSSMPYLCLVYPSGAHAGSAGAIILQACHVAGAMLATNIGAATPITGEGKDIAKDLKNKVMNDTTSWLEGITKLRERNLDFSKEIITKAKAVDAEEALKLKAIDFVAKTKIDFLNFSKNRKVKVNYDKKEILVSIGDLVEFKPDLRAQILNLIADPQITYILFMGSLGLLYFELTHPGTMVPGVIGGIGLVLSLISMHKLNVTWGAVMLIFLGLIFMIAEAFIPSFGALGLGGIASFVLGSVFLFDPAKSGHTLPLTLVIPSAVILGLLTMVLAYLAFQTRHIKKRGDFNDLEGQEGLVVKLNEDGQSGLISVHGETWKFKSKDNISMNSTVKVISHKGLTLMVKAED